MRVLVVESQPGLGVDDEQELVAAGHEVVRCHEEGQPSFPCAGLADHAACPLEAAPVDVALVVRDAGDRAPTHREAGISCALRARVPVIERATSAPDPFAAYVATFDGDVVAAAQAACDGPSLGHAEAVRRHLLTNPAAAAVDAEAVTVVAHRHGRTLHVEVTLPAEAPEALVAGAKGYAAVAARRYDPVVQVIDVVVVRR